MSKLKRTITDTSLNSSRQESVLLAKTMVSIIKDEVEKPTHRQYLYRSTPCLPLLLSLFQNQLNNNIYMKSYEQDNPFFQDVNAYDWVINGSKLHSYKGKWLSFGTNYQKILSAFSKPNDIHLRLNCGKIENLKLIHYVTGHTYLPNNPEQSYCDTDYINDMVTLDPSITNKLLLIDTNNSLHEHKFKIITDTNVDSKQEFELPFEAIDRRQELMEQPEGLYNKKTRSSKGQTRTLLNCQPNYPSTYQPIEDHQDISTYISSNKPTTLLLPIFSIDYHQPPLIKTLGGNKRNKNVYGLGSHNNSTNIGEVLILTSGININALDVKLTSEIYEQLTPNFKKTYKDFIPFTPELIVELFMLFEKVMKPKIPSVCPSLSEYTGQQGFDGKTLKIISYNVYMFYNITSHEHFNRFLNLINTYDIICLQEYDNSNNYINNLLQSNNNFVVIHGNTNESSLSNTILVKSTLKHLIYHTININYNDNIYAPRSMNNLYLLLSDKLVCISNMHLMGGKYDDKTFKYIYDSFICAKTLKQPAIIKKNRNFQFNYFLQTLDYYDKCILSKLRNLSISDVHHIFIGDTNIPYLSDKEFNDDSQLNNYCFLPRTNKDKYWRQHDKIYAMSNVIGDNIFPIKHLPLSYINDKYTSIPFKTTPDRIYYGYNNYSTNQSKKTSITVNNCTIIEDLVIDKLSDHRPISCLINLN